MLHHSKLNEGGSDLRRPLCVPLQLVLDFFCGNLGFLNGVVELAVQLVSHFQLELGNKTQCLGVVELGLLTQRPVAHQSGNPFVRLNVRLLGVHALPGELVVLGSGNQLCGNVIHSTHQHIAQVSHLLVRCAVESLCTLTSDDNRALLGKVVAIAIDRADFVGCHLCHRLHKVKFVRLCKRLYRSKEVRQGRGNIEAHHVRTHLPIQGVQEGHTTSANHALKTSVNERRLASQHIGFFVQELCKGRKVRVVHLFNSLLGFLVTQGVQIFKTLCLSVGFRHIVSQRPESLNVINVIDLILRTGQIVLKTAQ